MCHVNQFLISSSDVISQESRPLNIRIFIPIDSLQLQTYFRSSLTRILNQFINKCKVLTSIKQEVKDL